MKLIVIVASFLVSLLATAQTYTDVASLQGVDVIQQSDSHWGIGMAFYDFDNDGWDDLTFPTQFDSISFLPFRINKRAFLTAFDCSTVSK